MGGKRTKSFSDKTIEALKPGPKRQEIPVPGARGLYLMLQPSGAKSLAVKYRIGGRSQKFTLGACAAISLDDARTMAAKLLGDVAKGIDPMVEKVRQKQATQKAAANTFAGVCDDYFESVKLDGKMRSAALRYATMQRLVYPTLGRMPITEIRRSNMKVLLDSVHRQAGPVQADRVLAYIRRVFNWHAAHDDDFVSPIIPGMARTSTAERARTRVLSDDEVRVIWRASEGPGTFKALVRFLLLTAARRCEAGEMTRDEVKEGVWTLPASRQKTKVAIIRPLSKMALAVLEARPKVIDNPYFFAVGKKHFNDYSKGKRAFDEAVLAVLREDDPKAKELDHWTLHDLRRTARTMLADIGVTTEVAKQCLGHKLAGIDGTYNRAKYLTQKRDAFDKLADHIAGIVNPTPSKPKPKLRVVA